MPKFIFVSLLVVSLVPASPLAPLLAPAASAAACGSRVTTDEVARLINRTGRLGFDVERLGPEITALAPEDMARYVGGLANGGTPRGYEQAIVFTFRQASAAGRAALLRHLLDFDGDGYNTVGLLANDIDDRQRVEQMLVALIGEARQTAAGVKLLSDVDDTIYPNLVDPRYRKTSQLYPGVEALYRAIAAEPPEITAAVGDTLPLVTLSARPSVRGFDSAEPGLERLAAKFSGAVCAMSLGGEIVSSSLGTLFTFAEQGETPSERILGDMRSMYEGKPGDLGFLARQEIEIGRVKFSNYKRFALVYPDYDYVFFGDSGQADAYAAKLIMAHNAGSAGTGRAVASFIHDLRWTAPDGRMSGISPTALIRDAVADERVVLFRNHVDAALKAFELGRGGDLSRQLVEGAELLAVVDEALQALPHIEFAGPEAARHVKREFALDAAAALRVLDEAGQSIPERSRQRVAALCQGLQIVCPAL